MTSKSPRCCVTPTLVTDTPASRCGDRTCNTPFMPGPSNQGNVQFHFYSCCPKTTITVQIPPLSFFGGREGVQTSPFLTRSHHLNFLLVVTAQLLWLCGPVPTSRNPPPPPVPGRAGQSSPQPGSSHCTVTRTLGEMRHRTHSPGAGVCKASSSRSGLGTGAPRAPCLASGWWSGSRFSPGLYLQVWGKAGRALVNPNKSK